MNNISLLQQRMQPDDVNGATRLVPTDVQAAFVTSLTNLSEEFSVLNCHITSPILL